MLKRKTLKCIFSVLLIAIIVGSLFIYLYIQYTNKLSQKRLLNLADDIISENIVNNFSTSSNSDNKEHLALEQEVFSPKQISNDNNVIGKIKVPKIGLEAPIQDGTDAEVLKESVGHFTTTNYWEGNVVLASHNRGTYAHYFEGLDKLNLDDEIIYQTKLGTRIYVIDKIEQISEEDLSVLKNTKDNTLTLITCIKDHPSYRLCVKATEKKS